MRILIVGAGPTGLTAALELSRLGIVPTVIEKKTTPSGLSRAVGILPKSLEILGPSGVADHISEKGIALQTLRVFSRNTPILSLSLSAASGKNAVALAQNDTEQIMRTALEGYGGSVHYGVALDKCEQNGALVDVYTSDGKTSAYDIVIAADGIHSQTRQCTKIAFNGLDLAGLWSIADVNASNWDNNGSFTLDLLSEGQVAVVAPLEHNRFRVISNTDNALQSLVIPMHVSAIRREGTFSISVRQAHTYREGSIFLAGDAAHCHSPVGGRGMNLGIADAAELARCIVENRLDEYSANRHRIGAKTIALSERGRKIISSKNPLLRNLVVAVCRVVHRMPFLHARIAKVFLDA